MITKLTSAGWLTRSAPAPGRVVLDNGKVGAATTYPAAAQVWRKVGYAAGSETVLPWAKITSGKGPLAAGAPSPGPAVGSRSAG